MEYLVFYANGKALIAISATGTFSGETELIKDFLADKYNISADDITVLKQIRKKKGTEKIMNNERFNKVFETVIDKCKNTLCKKANEYATEDRLHNFKVAAEIQDCTPISALGGMMAKHTVSVYDLIRKHEQGFEISKELWDEKIGDSINYLILLTALIEDDREKRCSCGTVAEEA